MNGPRKAWVLLPTLLISLHGALLTAQTAPPADPLGGRHLFESKGCTGCHGIGDDGRKGAPGIDEGRFAGTFLEFGAALWNHAPGMSVRFQVEEMEWPTLSDREAHRLIAFLYFIDYLGRPGEAARGRELFHDKRCDACHTVGGGPARPGPDLAELSFHASPLYIAQRIWNHGPSMLETLRRDRIEPPRFERGEIADLSTFIRRQTSPARHQTMLGRPGNPNRGREVFADKGCAHCHGDEGRGGDIGPDLVGKDLRIPAEEIAATMWNHAFGMRDAMREEGMAWPEFADAELADLTAFLYFLPFADPAGEAARGEELFARRACDTCHAADGIAPDLASSDAGVSPAGLLAAMWNHAPVMKEAILDQGRAWPELSGEELRDLWAYLERERAEK